MAEDFSVHPQTSVPPAPPPPPLSPSPSFPPLPFPSSLKGLMMTPPPQVCNGCKPDSTPDDAAAAAKDGWAAKLQPRSARHAGRLESKEVWDPRIVDRVP